MLLLFCFLNTCDLWLWKSAFPPPQTPPACGTSLPAPKTSALLSSGCVMGRMTVRMAWMKVYKSVVRMLSKVSLK